MRKASQRVASAILTVDAAKARVGIGADNPALLGDGGEMSYDIPVKRCFNLDDHGEHSWRVAGELYLCYGMPIPGWREQPAPAEPPHTCQDLRQGDLVPYSDGPCLACDIEKADIERALREGPLNSTCQCGRVKKCPVHDLGPSTIGGTTGVTRELEALSHGYEIAMSELKQRRSELAKLREERDALKVHVEKLLNGGGVRR